MHWYRGCGGMCVLEFTQTHKVIEDAGHFCRREDGSWGLRSVKKKYTQVTGHTTDTGGKGSITQWVHAEYMEGSETIRPTFTQWVRGGYFSKVPTKVPTR